MSGELNRDELRIRFSYHAPSTEETIARYQTIRAHAHELARIIIDESPASREQSLAITALEEVVMWANAAIARRGS